MYKVIGSKRTRTIRVLWMLEELGLPYRHEPAPPQSAGASAANPSGKVPSLEVEGATITDSVAIMTFLADRHGRLTHPAGTVQRALQDAHTFFVLDEFDACLWTAARHSFVLPEERRVPQIKESLKWEFARSEKLFAERLAGQEFLMGDQMTVPDILAAHCGRWARNAKFELKEQRFADYVDRLLARPAFQRAAAD